MGPHLQWAGLVLMASFCDRVRPYTSEMPYQGHSPAFFAARFALGAVGIPLSLPRLQVTSNLQPLASCRDSGELTYLLAMTCHTGELCALPFSLVTSEL
jgi:hypothetical protein